MSKLVHISGKRKMAVARATVSKGSGKVRINNQFLDVFSSDLSRWKIREPLVIAGDLANKVDIKVNVFGGGVAGQADAVRLAIARALLQFSNDKKLEEKMHRYDRHLLVADIRRKEVCKPNDSKARKKRQKSYR